MLTLAFALRPKPGVSCVTAGHALTFRCTSKTLSANVPALSVLDEDRILKHAHQRLLTDYF